MRRLQTLFSEFGGVWMRRFQAKFIRHAMQIYSSISYISRAFANAGSF
jgi:hypothetical protein